MILKNKVMFVFGLMVRCMDLAEEINLDKNKKHTIEVVIDRIVVKEGIEADLADSLETCFKTWRG